MPEWGPMPTLRQIYDMDNHVRSVEAVSDTAISITFRDGETYEIDFIDDIGRGPITEPLSDPEFFRKVRQIEPNGYGIEWPNGYDCCPDTLRLDGELARRGLTRADAIDDVYSNPPKRGI